MRARESIPSHVTRRMELLDEPGIAAALGTSAAGMALRDEARSALLAATQPNDDRALGRTAAVSTLLVAACRWILPTEKLQADLDSWAEGMRGKAPSVDQWHARAHLALALVPHLLRTAADGSDASADSGADCAVEMACPNECSGAGKCHHGLCSCDPGRYGADCSGIPR